LRPELVGWSFGKTKLVIAYSNSFDAYRQLKIDKSYKFNNSKIHSRKYRVQHGLQYNNGLRERNKKPAKMSVFPGEIQSSAPNPESLWPPVTYLIEPQRCRRWKEVSYVNKRFYSHSFNGSLGHCQQTSHTLDCYNRLQLGAATDVLQQPNTAPFSERTVNKSETPLVHRTLLVP
jgi:hypothetical protein